MRRTPRTLRTFAHRQLLGVARSCTRRYFAQALGSHFGCDVALRAAKHLEADHELTYGGRTKQWRIEMRVQMPFRMGIAVRGTLVKAHRIGERRVEDTVVDRGDPLQDRSQS